MYYYTLWICTESTFLGSAVRISSCREKGQKQDRAMREAGQQCNQQQGFTQLRGELFNWAGPLELPCGVGKGLGFPPFLSTKSWDIGFFRKENTALSSQGQFRGMTNSRASSSSNLPSSWKCKSFLRVSKAPVQCAL